MTSRRLATENLPPLATHEVHTRGVRGWLVVDSVCEGLAFGGFRFSETTSEEEVKDLARAMTWKLKAHGMPVGGAKAGLCCRPDHPELPAMLVEVAEAWRRPLSESTVLGKDMGATDALLDGLYEALGRPQLALAQARGGGCPGRIRDLKGYMQHMTGRGAAWAAEAELGTLVGKRLAIQGAGLVGVGTAVRAHELGGVVVGISDACGAVASPDGIPIEALVAAASRDTRRIDPGALGFSCDRFERDQLLALDADVLVLAAGSRTVTAELARTVRAPVVIEASNLGFTDEARDVLHAAGVTVIPDIIASSSSAALVAHQIATGNGWEAEPLWERIAADIRGAVKVCGAQARRLSTSVRRAYIDHYG